jgi:hypothetical protein
MKWLQKTMTTNSTTTGGSWTPQKNADREFTGRKF